MSKWNESDRFRLIAVHRFTLLPKYVMRKGIAVSPGVTIGKAYCIHDVYVDPKLTHVKPSEVEAELARFENARR